MLDAPYPELDELLTTIGEAGRHLSEIEASEGAAGNISVYIGWPIDVRRRFPNVESLELPQAVPESGGQDLHRHRLGPPSARSHRRSRGEPRLSGDRRRRARPVGCTPRRASCSRA